MTIRITDSTTAERCMLGLVLALLLVSGCASGHRSGAAFGESTSYALRSQSLNPDAGDDQPLEGLNGAWAAKSMENYKNTPQPAREVKAVDLQSLFEVGTKQ